MTKMTIFEAAKADKAMRQESYLNEINRAIRMLEEAKNRPVSTHLGHNLGNVANELSTIAGRFEAMDSVVRFETEPR